MNCSERDQDILLLEHGALTPVRRWATERHLRACPRCQERREQHVRVTRVMSAAIREEGPDLRPFFGTADASVSSTVGTGMGTLRPVSFAGGAAAATAQPVARPGFIATVVAVASVIAAGAWIYKATALTPIYETDPPRVSAPQNIPRSKPGTRHAAERTSMRMTPATPAAAAAAVTQHACPLMSHYPAASAAMAAAAAAPAPAPSAAPPVMKAIVAPQIGPPGADAPALPCQ